MEGGQTKPVPPPPNLGLVLEGDRSPHHFGGEGRKETRGGGVKEVE